MVLLPLIFFTLLVIKEASQSNVKSEILPTSSEQLRDLIYNYIRLHLKAKGIQDNASNDNYYVQSSNDKQQHINTLNLYTKPNETYFPIWNQEFMTQRILDNKEKSDFKNKYGNIYDFSLREKSIENVKESLFLPREFQHNKGQLPDTTGDKNILYNNFYTQVNPLKDYKQIIPFEKASKKSNFQSEGIHSKPDIEETRSNFKYLYEHEKPKYDYVYFPWLPHKSEENTDNFNVKDTGKEYVMDNYRNMELTKLSNENNHQDSQGLQQSFYPEVVKELPLKHYRPYDNENVKSQLEVDLKKQSENLGYNPEVIKLLQKKILSHQEQQYRLLDNSHSQLQALDNLETDKSIDNIKELKKVVEQQPSPQKNFEIEGFRVVKQKALDIAQATNQRPPIIIHRVVSITKHIPIPVIKRERE